ncbi:molybdopterin-synthase adenylyltransferase MoeB [Alteromonas sp. C1M14]|uniref:HesA/MoeB/ThiF family protein n=1 Tax=Alteromonas sp. C1M14 TaxID=2841567 RepID=UPI001C08DEFF|nr:molybdopterin-synthase adenylyltransferase MoeB [Alteromonas sp. C1M14]MBU2977143.1 molybdopterin-synthase adenylyltransferase MoeB [Alteromonas sp. C1M14]
MPDTLTHAQVMRYNRHIVLPQFDLQGQETLCESAVLIIGLGGLGTALSQSLCASGVGALTLVDDDVVDAHNLPRQILYTSSHCGEKKVDAAKSQLNALNPECCIHTVDKRLCDHDLATLVAKHNVIVDCTDNLDSRIQINRLCWQEGKPLVSGAAIRFEGQLFVSVPAQKTSCYGCVSRMFNMTPLSCTEAGILSPVVGMIGLAQAHLVLQTLTGFGTLPQGQLQLFDGLTFQWQNFTVPRHPNCTVCGGSASAT